MQDRQEWLNRARERLASFLQDGGFDKMREAEEFLGYAKATAAERDQLHTEFPFFAEWKNVVRPKEREVEAAYRRYRKEHHPAVQVADLEHQLVYAEFADRFGVPHRKFTRTDSGEFKSERVPWAEEIADLRDRLEGARREAARAGIGAGPEYSYRLTISEELYPDLTVEVHLGRKPSETEWRAVEAAFDAWGSAAAPVGDEGLNAVANLNVSRKEERHLVSAFCEVGNLEAVEPLFRALDALNRNEFPGLVKTVALK